MPNWCNNNISISGPISKIKPMFEAATQDANDETGLLDFMCPMPKELHDTTSPSDGPNWYDWRVSNWSTKWEVSSEGLEYSEDTENGTAEITGWFDSAWSPPIGAMTTYGEANPDVSIVLDYHEPGMCYVGRLTVDGEDVDDDYVDYSGSNAKTVRDVIGEDYDDNWGISEMMAEWEDEEEEEDE